MSRVRSDTGVGDLLAFAGQYLGLAQLGDGLTSRTGTAPLSGLADALGLTDGLVRGLAVHERAVRHEPGRVARDLAVMLADGGDALTDLGALLDQEVLFGDVAADSTAYRCVERLDEGVLARPRAAHAAASANAWQMAGGPECWSYRRSSGRVQALALWRQGAGHGLRHRSRSPS